MEDVVWRVDQVYIHEQARNDEESHAIAGDVAPRFDEGPLNVKNPKRPVRIFGDFGARVG